MSGLFKRIVCIALAFLCICLSGCNKGVTKDEETAEPSETPYVNEKWYERAEIAQQSFDHFYLRDDKSEMYNNYYPVVNEKKENSVFNFWWHAHLIDIRIDAYIRTKDTKYLEMADEVYNYAIKRNGNTLKNDFYDDMLWYALALTRLYTLTDNEKYLDDAVFVWNDLVETGWDPDKEGEFNGFSWKRDYREYINVPSNGPFIILSARLYQLKGDEKYFDWATKTYDWVLGKLVDEETGLVGDGINRSDGKEPDGNNTYTYNQGLFIGANLELYKITQDEAYIDAASKTAETAINTFSLKTKNLFRFEGDGDGGLFKGIFYRYAKELLLIRDNERVREFITGAAEILWDNSFDGENILAGKMWDKSPRDSKNAFSMALSGIMAIEAVYWLAG